ncbi:MAG: hypothetical protein JWP19_501 [Rhodoglobus sp.]|nr:hypothetical protein [Rhodoglobus sp.]
MTSRTPVSNWHTEHKATLTRGQRAADIMRNGMGSWPFVGGFILFMIIWAIINSTAARWDPYPVILLNLFLSMLAGMQGAILLIAAKRQDALAAALAKHDYDTNVTAKKDIESLLEINRKQYEIVCELQEVLHRLDITPPKGAALKLG